MSSNSAASKQAQSKVARRDFLKTGTTAALAGGLVTSLGSARMAHATSDDTLKVALIGCGGRGTGAAINAMNADKNAKLTVLCDIFPDRIAQCKNVLKGQLGDQLAVDDANCFSDFDGYKKVMESDVDVVLLCTTPHFRPVQLAAAIDAGKHVFCEKPVAVDGPGVRSVLETCKKAKEKNLNVVSGLCWRYDLGVVETMKRIQDGAIGEIVTIQENYLTGTLWDRPRDPSWSEMEYQIRNWLYFTWLSGDHIAEQHIHSLDKALWLNNDKMPTYCYGLGGRQVRTDPKFGHVYDHFSVVYEWENGVRAYAFTRQMAGCWSETEDFIYGTKGKAEVLAHKIKGVDGEWKYKGPKPSMYDVEHQRLFAAIRAGEAINNGEYMSYATLMAIMGREACYTGEKITSEAMLNSHVKLGPEKLEWGNVAVAPVAMPGRTKFDAPPNS